MPTKYPIFLLKRSIIHSAFKDKKEYDNKAWPNAAVAINVERFVLKVNHSFTINFSEDFTQDVAIAHVLDVKTQKDVVLICAYVPEFDVMSPEKEKVEQGDQYIQIILERLIANKLVKYNTIMGADMNANPDLLKNHSIRFQNLHSAGFLDFWAGNHTNINMDKGQEEHQLREIDCILYRQPKKVYLLQS